MPGVKNFFSEKAFSLLELLTAGSIMVVLSVIGIKSYQAQVNKARTAEAQESLSYVFSSEQVFHNNWDWYDENLMVVGLIPSGQYYYDVGFTQAGDVTAYEYPERAKDVVSVLECSTFELMCKGECLNGIQAAASTYHGYFSNPSCDVLSRQPILDGGSKCTLCPSASADGTSFKAIAVEKLKTRIDIWSINEKQQIVHEEDGT